MKLNDFHKANIARQHEAFAPAHSLTALVVCVQEEVGELAGAVLGVTGEKKRKAHKTREDVLDAVADAMTYLSLVAGSVGCEDLEALLADTFNMVSERCGSKIKVESAPVVPASQERGANCHRCGHYETSLARATGLYAHCPSCGRHTRWLATGADVARERDNVLTRAAPVIAACVAWQKDTKSCHFCGYEHMARPHDEDCPLVVGEFVDRKGRARRCMRRSSGRGGGAWLTS